MLTPGTLVKWAVPQNADEETELYRIIEVRGDSVLCEDATGTFEKWSIRPVFTFRTEELLTA